MSYHWNQDDASVGQQVALLTQLLHTASFGPLPPEPAVVSPAADTAAAALGLRHAASYPPGYGPSERHDCHSSDLKRAQSMLAQLASLQLGAQDGHPDHNLLGAQGHGLPQVVHPGPVHANGGFGQQMGWGSETIKHQHQQPQHHMMHDNGYHASRTAPRGRTGFTPRGERPRKGSARTTPRQGAGRGSRHHGAMADSPVDEVFLRIKLLKQNESVAGLASETLRLFDSRGVAALIKELAKSGAGARAAELFDWLSGLPPGHELVHLADVYTYTAAISNCVPRQELDRALRLLQQMRERGVERNVHTYSALMNVCIKCGRLQLALEVYSDMRAEGCNPNVVTYNTLVDVYGKCGMWEDALRVLDVMRSEGIDPVTRTYNTLMIACNTSGQWQQALRVYKGMSTAGFAPNTTTFNALISAYSKAGNLAKVMETFHTMVQQGCERSVITYSSLISACEKAGECHLALQLFDDMLAEGCRPNVISYNSLITACAQGGQWDKASEVFEQMQQQGCTPDVVSYTALIGAYEKGGQWRKALQTFEQMQAAGCSPDAIVYSAIIDALWDTGVASAQARAAELFREAAASNLVLLGRTVPLHASSSSPSSSSPCPTSAAAAASGGGPQGTTAQGTTGGCGGGGCGAGGMGSAGPQQVRPAGSGGAGLGGGGGDGSGVGKAAEVNLQGATPGIALLSLEVWLQDLRDLVRREGPSALPEQCFILTGKPKQGGTNKPESGRGGGSVRDAVAALLRHAGAPFEECGTDPMPPYSGCLRAHGTSLAPWLMMTSSAGGDAPSQPLLPLFPRGGGGGAGGASSDDSPCLSSRSSTSSAEHHHHQQQQQLDASAHHEQRAVELLANVQYFEGGGASAFLRLQALESSSPPSCGPSYLAQRPELLTSALACAAAAGLSVVAVCDALMLLDRLMAVPLQVESAVLPLLLAACIAIALRQAAPLPSSSSSAIGPSPSSSSPSSSLPLADLGHALGVSPEVLADTQATVAEALGGDTSCLSAMHCLQVYCQYLGWQQEQFGAHSAMLACGPPSPVHLLLEALRGSDCELLGCRPSMAAAAALIAYRRACGLLPYWPTSLAILTGYDPAKSPEMTAAVNCAIRLAERMLGRHIKPLSRMNSGVSGISNISNLTQHM